MPRSSQVAEEGGFRVICFDSSAAGAEGPSAEAIPSSVKPTNEYPTPNIKTRAKMITSHLPRRRCFLAWRRSFPSGSYFVACFEHW
jgi:hypothetical protein